MNKSGYFFEQISALECLLYIKFKNMKLLLSFIFLFNFAVERQAPVKYEYTFGVRNVNTLAEAAKLTETLQEFFEIDSSINASDLQFDDNTDRFRIQSSMDLSKKEIVNFGRKKKIKITGLVKEIK